MEKTPMRIRYVAPASTPAMTKGEGHCRSTEKWFSATHRESKPNSSANMASANSSRPTTAPPCVSTCSSAYPPIPNRMRASSPRGTSVGLVLRWIPIGIVAFTHCHRGVMLNQTPLRADPFKDIRGLNSADHRDSIARIDDIFHTAHPGHLVG